MRMNALPRREAAADRGGEDKTDSTKDVKTDSTETNHYPDGKPFILQMEKLIILTGHNKRTKK